MAKHNASTAPVEGEPVPYSRGRLFNFDTDNLPLKDLAPFIDALSTVSSMLSGLQEQPRFSADSGYTATGRLLGGESPASTVADLARLVADFNWQLYMARQKGGAA